MTEELSPTIRVVLLPKDTNAYGVVFGGVIMSHLDIAGAIEARRHTTHRVVTVAIDKIEFVAPVFVGDVVSFYTQLQSVGRTSVTVSIDVEADRTDGGGRVRVTQAQAVYVALNDEGKPTPVRAV